MLTGRLFCRVPLLCRLSAVRRQNSRHASLAVHPVSAMMDEPVDIRVTGLDPGQLVTLHAGLQESGIRFDSRAVYRASQQGTVSCTDDEALDGSYTGQHPMGLFWSLSPSPGQGEGHRLKKKDATTPLELNLKLLPGNVSGDVNTFNGGTPLTQTTVERWYMKAGVARVPVKTGPLRGTMFIPEGPGPFPGVVDMFGGLISLIETRAALLASHGYATFAIAYLGVDHLPRRVMHASSDYVVEACEWFNEQPHVCKDRLGAVSVCLGATMALEAAVKYPKLQAIVDINGPNFAPKHMQSGKNWWPGQRDHYTWPDKHRVRKTNEGLDIKDVFECENPSFISSWKHGAKVLCIVGEDDKQFNPKWHARYKEAWPSPYKDNIEVVHYPGAGHLIEPPYAPLCRTTYPTRARMVNIDFAPEEVHDEFLMTGGFPVPHAHAQEDGWRRTLEFLERTIR